MFDLQFILTFDITELYIRKDIQSNDILLPVIQSLCAFRILGMVTAMIDAMENPRRQVTEATDLDTDDPSILNFYLNFPLPLSERMYEFSVLRSHKDEFRVRQEDQ